MYKKLNHKSREYNNKFGNTYLLYKYNIDIKFQYIKKEIKGDIKKKS